MLRKICLSITLFTTPYFLLAQDLAVKDPTPASPAREQDPKPVISITGSADVYYRIDFGKNRINNLTSFTNSDNSFALGMASVKVQHKTDKMEMVADVGLGTRVKEFAYNEEGLLSAIKQLYVSYTPTGWLKLTAGTWATHVGYELLDPQLNRNYSMSYLFTNGPFHHTGVKAELTKGKSGFMIGLSNATDYRIPQEGRINKRFLLAQYHLDISENLKVYLNYVGGKNPDTSKSHQFDMVLTEKMSDRFNIGLNATINTIRSWDGVKNTSAKNWWGTALYLNYDPRSWLGFTLREEWFNDHNQLKQFAAAPAGGTVWASTFSVNLKSGGFLFIPEFRIDRASEFLFQAKGGTPRKTTGSFLLAAVYAF